MILSFRLGFLLYSAIILTSCASGQSNCKSADNMEVNCKTFVTELTWTETNKKTSRLHSNWICATKNIFYSLEFKFTIFGEFCQLSVHRIAEVRAENFSRPLWKDNTQGESFMTTGDIHVSSVSQRFRVWIQAEHLQTKQYCRFGIADIVFKYAGLLPPQETDDGGLSGGAIAGIVISLFVVILVIVASFFLLRRRTAGAKLSSQRFIGRLRNVMQTSSESTTDTHASAQVNRPIIDGPYPEITSDNGQLPQTKDYYSVPSDFLRGNDERSKPEHGSDYTVSVVAESSNYYSMPRDEGNATGALGGGKTNPGYVAEDDGGYSTPDDIDRLEMDRQKSNATQTARGGKIGAAGDSYNEISFQPLHAGSSRKAADTYHHINPLEHADTGTVNSTGVGMRRGVQDEDNEYKVPRSEHAEYSLATDPGDPYDRPPTTPTGKTQNTDLTGKKGASCANNTDYNHLKLKDGDSPPAGATSGKGKGEGVYNHLEGQVQIDNYNRVDFDGRGGDKQTGDSSGPYNHLGD